ncbi:MAG: hypothetical protein JWP08_4221 [Bryobacterales bacterium]|nr:hypothetical protein [Bryobacterales bacterium]
MVTSLAAGNWPAQKVYEDLYCARGDTDAVGWPAAWRRYRPLLTSSCLACAGWLLPAPVGRDRSAKPFACNCCVSALECASALARSGFPWRAVIRIGARSKTLTCNSAPEIVSHPFFDNRADRNAHSTAELALKAVAPGRARLQDPPQSSLSSKPNQTLGW